MELEDLEPLVGEWATSATLPGSEPKRVVSGRTTFAWLERGGYLVQHAAADDPAFPVGVMVIGPDLNGDRIVQHYFDSRGVARVYEIGLEDGVLRLWRDGPDFAQRFTGRFSADGRAIEGAWERRADNGAAWEQDFDLSYRRV